MRQRRGVLERHPGRDRQERLLGRARRTRRRRPARTRTGRPKTPSPGLKRVTPGPTASTTPATSMPTAWFRGARMPMNRRTKPGCGPRPSRSARLTDAARTRTSTWSSAGIGSLDLAELDDLGRTVPVVVRALHVVDRIGPARRSSWPAEGRSARKLPGTAAWQSPTESNVTPRQSGVLAGDPSGWVVARHRRRTERHRPRRRGRRRLDRRPDGAGDAQPDRCPRRSGRDARRR